MKQTDWTDRLRKRMERQEEPVGDELWAGIEQALDDRSVAVAARRLALRRWVAAAAVVVSVAGGGILWLSRHKELTDRPMAAEQTLLQRRDAIRQSMSLVPSESAGTPAFMARIEPSPHGQVAPSTSLSPSMVAVTKPDCSEPTVPPVADEPTATPRPSQPKPAPDMLPQPAEPMDGHLPRRASTSSVGLRLHATNGLLAYTRHDRVEMAPERQNEYHAAKANRLPSRAAGTGDEAPAYLVGYGEKARHDLPVSVGLTVDVPLGGGWSLTTGVVYTRLNATFTQQMRGLTIESRQQLDDVGLPLQLSHSLWHSRRLAVYATGGGQVDFNVRACMRTEGSRQPMKRDRPQLSAVVGVGAVWRLTPAVGLYAEPSVRYSPDNGSGVSTYFKEKPFSPALQLGLKIQTK